MVSSGIYMKADDKAWYERINWKDVVVATYVAGTMSVGAYLGARHATMEYMSKFDEPQLMAETIIRMEQLPDGRIHLYKKTEDHKYMLPQWMIDPRPQEQPAPSEKTPNESDLEGILKEPSIKG